MNKSASSPYRWKSQRSYTGEIPRIVIHLEADASSQDSNRYGDGNFNEDIENKIPEQDDEASDMPDLQDSQVEKAALAIQKAFKRSHAKQNT